VIANGQVRFPRGFWLGFKGTVCCLEWFICWAAAAWWAAVSVSRAVLDNHFIRDTLPLNYFFAYERNSLTDQSEIENNLYVQGRPEHNFIRATLPLNYFFDCEGKLLADQRETENHMQIAEFLTEKKLMLVIQTSIADS
jgi:hypothetical protein